jgi:hypothetical protein
MLSIEAAMVAQYAEAGTNKAGLGVGVAAFYVFLIIYSFGIDVCGVLFYSELFPNHIRAKGSAMCFCSIALTDLIYLQATAEAFANIGENIRSLFVHHPPLRSFCTLFYLPYSVRFKFFFVSGHFPLISS